RLTRVGHVMLARSRKLVRDAESLRAGAQMIEKERRPITTSEGSTLKVVGSGERVLLEGQGGCFMSGTYPDFQFDRYSYEELLYGRRRVERLHAVLKRMPPIP